MHTLRRTVHTKRELEVRRSEVDSLTLASPLCSYRHGDESNFQSTTLTFAIEVLAGALGYFAVQRAWIMKMTTRVGSVWSRHLEKKLSHRVLVADHQSGFIGLVLINGERHEKTKLSANAPSAYKNIL